MKQKTMLYMDGKETIVDAADTESFAALLADGWADTPTKKAVEPKTEAPKELPPTRAELEAKGKELAIKFDGRTSDNKLAQLIAEKLAEA